MQEILASTSPIASLNRHQNASTPVNDDQQHQPPQIQQQQSRLKLSEIKSEMGKRDVND